MKMKALSPRPRTPATMRAAILNIWDNLEDSIRAKTIDTFRKYYFNVLKEMGDLLIFNVG